MKNLKKISFLLGLVTILFSSCNKDDDNSTPGSGTTTSFTSADLTAKIPTSLATKSPETSSQINSMVGYMSIGEAFKQTRPAAKMANKSAGGTDTWTYGEYTITYTGSDNSTQHQYTYTIKQGSTTLYTITGWDNINGTAGHWVLDMSAAITYGTAISIDFDWAKNSSNDFNLDMVVTAGSETTEHLVANINHDSSGNVKGYYGSTLSFESTWNSSGSGQYINYETNPATTTNY